MKHLGLKAIKSGEVLYKMLKLRFEDVEFVKRNIMPPPRQKKKRQNKQIIHFNGKEFDKNDFYSIILQL